MPLKNKEVINLLVVDDNKDILIEIISIVKGKSFEVHYAKNGQVGLDLALEELPDLILMDWDMPVMDGIQAVRRLKSQNETKNIPIVMMTGVNVSNSNLAKALEEGAIDFLHKPFDPTTFQARVDAVIRREKLFKENVLLAKREKEAIQKAHIAQKRELLLMSTLEVRRVELLKSLLQQIERLNSLTRFTKATEINGIGKEIKAILKPDRTWHDFKSRFEELNPDFYSKLEEWSPNLSANEKRLLAYLKMGKSNFEIASLCGISNHSVSKSLYRLKKKLKLERHNDLRKVIISKF